MGRTLAHCCTALVGAETLLRAEGTEKGTENIPLPYIFFPSTTVWPKAECFRILS